MWGGGMEELSGILLSVGPGSQGAWLGTLLPLCTRSFPDTLETATVSQKKVTALQILEGFATHTGSQENPGSDL